MSYKTILVHVDESKAGAARIKLAANIAMAESAHLVGVVLTGVSKFSFANGSIDDTDRDFANYLKGLHDRAGYALAEFESIVKKMGVASYESRMVDDEAGAGLSLQARYGDLVVVGQTDPDEPGIAGLRDFPEYVMMNSGRPVLLVPYTGRFETLGKKVLIAWDASMEATRAVTAAIPLLKHASLVDVAVFNPSSRPDVHGEQPGADIALYLARHNVKVNVTQQSTDIDIGNALLSLAADRSSDLIVMGGYGHSRFREILLGGATRTVLQTMTVPVLMSH